MNPSPVAVDIGESTVGIIVVGIIVTAIVMLAGSLSSTTTSINPDDSDPL